MKFVDYLKSFKSKWGMGIACATACAGIFNQQSLSPPSPETGGAAPLALAIIACFLGICIAYNIRMSKGDMKKRGVQLLCASLAILLLYVFFLTTRTFNYPRAIYGEVVYQRIVIGTELRFKEDEKQSTAKLIENYGTDGNAWTDSSILGSKILLNTTYILFYFALTLGFGLCQKSESGR